jgi:hypothetical protein
MLTLLFIMCAVVGGALVLAQLLLSVVAFGAGRGFHVHHGGGASAATHRGGFFRGAHGHRGSLHAHPAHAVGTAAQQQIRGASAQKPVHGGFGGHWALAWVQSMFNFQGIVSGATVLGLAGLAATSAKLPGYVALAIGIGAALVMMALIDGAFGLMENMDNDGTVDIQQAVGKIATVYLSIPAKSEGLGKITMNLQQRLMEFSATTFKDKPLATGQRVVVVAVLGSSVMLVVAEEDYQAETEK